MNWQPSLPPGRIALAAVACAVAVAWVYLRGERAPLRTALGLALLRLGVVGLVTVALLNPTEVRSRSLPGDKPMFFILVDTSASMATNDVDGESRFTAARRLVVANYRWLSALGRRFHIRFHRFDKDAGEADLAALRRMEKPQGPATDIGAALAEVVRRAADDEQHAAAGALLISDGRDNGRQSPLAMAEMARSAGLRVWTLCLGQRAAVHDVAVLCHRPADFAFAKQPTQLSVDLRAVGLAHRSLQVQLEREGQPVAARTVSVSESDARSVQFPVTETRPGLYRYTFSVAPQSGEMDVTNNRATLFLRVVGQRVRVLLIDARPTWDTKFLCQTLRREPNVQLTAVYHFAEGRDFAITNVEGQQADEIHLPHTIADLQKYDVVMIGKGFEDLLTSAGVEMLKQFLLRSRGSVVFFRGKADQGCPELRDLEPVIWSERQVRDLQLSLTEEGRRLLTLPAGTSQDVDAIVHRLPHLISATHVADVTSLAVVLARGAQGDEAEPMATVAYQRYGAGRVMVVAAQGLWRWAFLPGDDKDRDIVYGEFWRQVVRWLVSGSEFLPGHDYSVRTSRLSYEPGETVNILIDSRLPQPSSQLWLTITSPDGRQQRMRPTSREQQGADMTAVYTPRAPGDYVVELRWGSRPFDKVETGFVVAAGAEETLVVDADPALMQQIAETSGGEALAPKDLERLPDLVHRAAAGAQVREERVPTWDRSWMLAALVLLLAVEWYWRRREGMC